MGDGRPGRGAQHQAAGPCDKALPGRLQAGASPAAVALAATLTSGAAEILDAPGHLLRLVVVQHVAGILDAADLAARHGLQTAVVFGQVEAVLPPLAQAVVAGFQGQHRRSDGGVVRQHLVHAEQLGVDHLVRGIAQDGPAPLRIGGGPFVGQPQGLVGIQAAVGLAQARGHVLDAVVGLELDGAGAQLLQLVQPLAHAGRGLLWARGRQPEAFQVHQAADACRPGARVQHGHVAAHAVADQVHGLAVRGVVVQQRVQVAQVVGKAVVVAGRGRQAVAKAAPVRRDDVAAAVEIGAEGIDHELVGRAHVHPAVQQHQRRHAGLGLAPGAHAVAQVAQGQVDGGGGAQNGVHGPIIGGLPRDRSQGRDGAHYTLQP